MSNQAIRQVWDDVYSSLKLGLQVAMTDEDWAIMFNSSLVGRKMWAFDMVENDDHYNDSLLMVDLTIENMAARSLAQFFSGRRRR